MKLSYFFILLLLIVATSCGDGFLDIKPNKQTLVPTTINDFQGLLDNSDVFNCCSPIALGIIGADEFYITDAHYTGFASGPAYNYQKNAYTWEREVYEGNEPNTIDWTTGYAKVLQANVALDGLAKIIPAKEERTDWEHAKGCALFHRAYAFYNLAQLYCAPYDTHTASSDFGLPLRLGADPSIKVARSNVADTYGRILRDLLDAESLLPAKPTHFVRPSKQAVYALLTKVFMQMGDYVTAADYASRCLQIGDELLDFNRLDITSNTPFPAEGIGNPEVIFMIPAPSQVVYSVTRINIDTVLLSEYGQNDLRRIAYFSRLANRTIFKGSYKTQSLYFAGLATDEVCLNFAECLARMGDTDGALHSLNYLLKHRIDENEFTPVQIGADVEIMPIILAERRKELVLRGVRWEDLRRLNKEGNHVKTLKRVVNGRVFSLPPNDPKWVWPLPPEAVRVGGYVQYKR